MAEKKGWKQNAKFNFQNIYYKLLFCFCTNFGLWFTVSCNIRFVTNFHKTSHGKDSLYIFFKYLCPLISYKWKKRIKLTQQKVSLNDVLFCATHLPNMYFYSPLHRVLTYFLLRVALKFSSTSPHDSQCYDLVTQQTVHPPGAADRQSSWHWGAGKESGVRGILLHNAEEAACGGNTQTPPSRVWVGF